jgi:hypothetical protein
MKENEPAGKDEALSKLLSAWKPEAQLPLRFQEAVWRRIETADAELKVSVWQTLRARVEAAFARPALAAAYVAVLLAAGVSVGYWRAEDRSAEVQSELRARYVQNIDPYQMPRQ